MKYIYYLSSLVLFPAIVAKAQKIDSLQEYRSILNNTHNRLTTEIGAADKLVSNYTFRNLIRNDFSMLLTGDKNKTTIGKYAALDINSTEKRFTLTPIAYIPGNDPLISSFHHVFSLDITGAVTGEKFFNFKDRNTITAGLSYTFVGGGYNFDDSRKPDTSIYRRIYDRISSQSISKYIGAIDTSNPRRFSPNIIDSVENNGFLNDSLKLVRAYLEKVKDSEDKLIGERWSSKSFWWFKITANAVSNDNFYLVNPTNLNTQLNPEKKSVYNPSLQFSGNYYKIYKSGLHIYTSGYIKIARKHSLSEIYSAKQWNKINPINDSIYLGSENKSVYYFDDTKFSTKVIKDVGLQFIAIKDFGNVLHIGIDLKYDNIGFIKPESTQSISRIETFSFGLIFPLKDKDGKSMVNIEPFYQYRQYIDYEKSFENLWGIRFSIPFKNVL